MPREPQLPDEEHVERDAQRVGHLMGDRDASAREREHQDVGVIRVGRQLGCERPARVGAVTEQWLNGGLAAHA